MDKNQLAKFDPTVAELTLMVEKTKGITATDLKDKAQLAIVRETRIELRNARINITKIGKSLREDAINFQKIVITKEKELIGIIEPEECRLGDIEEEAKQLTIREERLALLPMRKERLAAIDSSRDWATDEALLELGIEAFEGFFNQCTAAYNEGLRLAIQAGLDKEREAFEEEKRKEAEKNKAEQDKIDQAKKAIEDEKRDIAHKKEVEEAAKKAKEQAEAKAKQEAEDKIKADKAFADLKRRVDEAEKAKLEKRKAFISFREKHGYTEETKDDFITKETEVGYELYKKVGIFNK